jgi:hypothetical protein
MAAGDAEGEPTGDITAKVAPLDKTYVVEIGSDQKRMEGPAHSPPSITALALILPILRLRSLATLPWPVWVFRGGLALDPPHL